MRVILVAALLSLVAPQVAGSDGEADFLLGRLCHVDELPPIAGPHKLVMVPGMGNDHLAADTRNADAQNWFDYALTLSRAFEHNDAILAFQKAEAADPGCSLCVWGEAYARGPTINFLVSADQTAANLVLASKAQAMAGANVPQKIKDLEAAMVDRYRVFDSKGASDKTYAQDIDAMNARDPGDLEVAIFAAEAWLVMEQHDDHAAAAQRAVDILRPLMAANPDYTGLIHFYIHATELAGKPELAEPYAPRLAELAPAASHMVHMPSHTYYRVGRYEDAARANVDALKADRAYAEKTDFPTPLGKLMYHAHDLQFGLGGAMMSGDGAVALQLVDQFQRDFPQPSTYNSQIDATAGQTYAAFGRFAAPDAVLAAPDLVASSPFLEAMRHYARGEAFARLGRAADVRAEAAKVVLPAGGLDKTAPLNGTSSVVVQVAQRVLEGRADMLEHDPAAAIVVFREAADLQDAHLADYSDPPRWWYPVRRSLAAALFAQGDAAGAEREASATLKDWKLDPMTLAIRAQAEEMRHEPGAEGDMDAARKGWRGDPAALSAGALS